MITNTDNSSTSFNPEMLHLYTETELQYIFKFVSEKEEQQSQESNLYQKLVSYFHIPSSNVSEHGTNNNPNNINNTAIARRRQIKILSSEAKPLTLDQKLELANKAVDITRHDVTKLEQDQLTKLDNLEAQIEALSTQKKEFESQIADLNKMNASGAFDHPSRPKKLAGEKVIKHLHEYLQQLDNEISKTQLLKTHLKQSLHKIQNQVKQKEESGDSLLAIDFDQLTIENAQYQVKIMEKNNELLSMKKNVGNAVMLLNKHKQELVNEMTTFHKLTTELKLREDIHEKLEKEYNGVEQECLKIEESNSKYMDMIGKYNVPNLMDYVAEKQRQKVLEQSLKTYQRKLDIQEALLKRLTKKKN